ncbi:hypothetical protein SAMN05660206_104229 [Sphingobacterium wenxiniae]|uniref:Uncharacterized protein n=1 Tax=Sphingobacterium wenxiniae TaxID=683125 RepID=A0A1I6SCZ5_9SPHI|nr:hypothetical protein SAMN05660206_104229 [Sphingobacterium wenxiniae]
MFYYSFITLTASTLDTFAQESSLRRHCTFYVILSLSKDRHVALPLPYSRHSDQLSLTIRKLYLIMHKHYINIILSI